MKWLSLRRAAFGLYLVLLMVSHVVRVFQPERRPAEDQQVQLVMGSPPAEAGPVAIAYWQWRPATDPADEPAPLLLLHGSPGAGSSFRRLGAALAEDRRVLAPDLPGFGASTTEIPDYSIRAAAQTTLQFLDSLAIDQVHVVGFSLGGGVAMEMQHTQPERLASLTFLSSIGVQENELLGDYHLNHAIHTLQLFVIWAVTELVPHFGLADNDFLNREYARSFYDTDQRPLRQILQELPHPVLIVHGSQDPLVPLAAALESHRIVPQSELVLLEGDHFMTFRQPDLVAEPVASFIERVDAGVATVRATATPERLRAAATPFDNSAILPVEGIALLVTLLLLVLATFVSEDLTCIGAGLLIARGSLPWLPGVAACLAGIFIGDLLLYAGGRLLGRPLVRTAPLRWLVGDAELERCCRWFAERSGGLILWGRFIPGTRLPTYVAAGVVRLPLALFSFWALVAVSLWTPLLVGVTALFGSAAAEWIQAFQDRSLLWLLVTGVGTLLTLRIVLPLLTATGRKRFLARWGRLHRWEFWPPWVFYIPVMGYVGWLALRYRSLTVFTAANPGIVDGGFVGESKFQLLSAIRDQKRVARTSLFSVSESSTSEDPQAFARQVKSFPVVVKPDVGERGAGVEVIHNYEALLDRLTEATADLLVQEYVAGKELGIFYYRIPGKERGQIFTITTKMLPVVTGDGRRTLEELILDDDRLRCQARVFARQLGAMSEHVPALGEEVTLCELGNHCLGCQFGDGAHLATPALADTIEQVSRSIPGFYFGRYDLRGPTLTDIQAGHFQVIELNGVSSEATNIYDPANSLFSAYRTLFAQWSLAFKIGAANRARGIRPTGTFSLLASIFRHFRRR